MVQATPAEINDLWFQATDHHKAGQVAEAADLYRRILSIEPRHHAAMNYLGAALACAGENEEALRCFAESVRMLPTGKTYWLNYGAMLESVGRIDDAADCYERAGAVVKLAKIENLRKRYQCASDLLAPLLAAEPDNIELLDALVVANHHLGNVPEARRLARHSLIVRDRSARPGSVTLHPHEVPPPPSPETRPRNAIAFSLWGVAPRYVTGMLDNIARAGRHFPHWHVRIYCAGDVPRDAREAMIAAGADVIDRPIPKPSSLGLFWRFEPICEELDRVLVRDADCRIGAKEAAAVAAWIESKQPFHIMRDHICNNELILAGLWGAICGTLAGFAEASAAYRLPTLTRWTDQLFLRKEVWPAIRDCALIHDDSHDLFNAQPFPAWTVAYNEPPFVGASYL